MKTETWLSSLSLVVAFAAACGGNVVVDAAGKGGSPTTTSTSSSAVGGATTTNTNTSTTFEATTGTATTGTATSGTTVATTSVTTTAATSSGLPSCVGGAKVSFENNGIPMTSLCDANWNPQMATTPIGYVFSGGPPPGGEALNVEACTGSASGSEGFHLTIPNAAASGQYMFGTGVTFNDGQGGTWVGNDFPAMIGQFDPVGGMIQGSFTAKVQNPMQPAQMQTLQVFFSVCHAPDEIAP